MTEWSNSDDRRADARAEYEKIMTSPSPDPTGAYIETGVIGFVFGEMWRRGVLTPRDRRLITLSCVGAAGATIPIETHVWAALNSGDLSYAEFDEFVSVLRNATWLAQGVSHDDAGHDVRLPHVRRARHPSRTT